MSRTRYCPRCLTTFTEVPLACPNLGCGAPTPDPWPTLLQAGDLLDRTYRIRARLAGGAAGMTYRARELGDGDVPVGPELAIKVLYAERDTGPFVQRLATEAQILQSLHHPHILECRGFVHRTGKPPYLITRFEAGGTLSQHIGRVGPLSPRIAARVLLQIVDALRVAHAAQVIHRDLKPANVLLTHEVPADETPQVRIADFGIAKVHGSLSGLTRVGAFVGTPEDAAPEQFLGHDPTPATDLFAAAGILWFMLTGRQPLDISQRHDPLHTHDEVLDQIPPRLPPALRESEAGLRLQDVVDGWMTPKAADRAEVQTILDALEDAAEADDAGALPRSAPVMGTGGTLFVEDDEELHTFIWTPGDEPQAAPPTLIAPPAEPTADAIAAPAAPPPVSEPAPEPTRARPSSSTMEGLFDFAPSTPPAEPPPTPRAPSLFEEAFDAEEAPRAPHEHDPAVQEALDARASREAPVSLPVDAMDILALLGRDTHRTQVLARIETWSDADIRGWLRQAKRHPEPTTRIGGLRAIVSLERADLASNARAALRDPIAAVRAEAAHTLGAIGGGSLLTSLPRLLADEEPSVRAAAAAGIAQAHVRTGDVKRGLHLLDQHGTDPDAEVRRAVASARSTLTRAR